MPQLTWSHLIGQDRAKEVLGSAVAGGRLGHAYLFTGAEGTGKLQAAVELGMGLLCETSGDVPCYTCGSCKRVLTHAHPDFHLIFPVVLGPEHKSSGGDINDAGWEYLSGETVRRINHPYALEALDGVPVIPVEWIREANRAIQRGTVEGRRSVTIIDGIDVMQKESANAMLKTLEEPPAGTLMLLLTDRPQSVLQTIVSRCQVLRFGYLTPEQIAEGLARHGPREISTEVREQAVSFALGSLARALDLIAHPISEAGAPALEFWRLCCTDDRLALAARIDELAGAKDFDAVSRIFLQIGHAARNGCVTKIAAPEKYIHNGDDLAVEVGKAAPSAERSAAVLDLCRQSLSALHARGNTALVLVNFAQRITEILHE